jgi:hypothetical protein
MGLKIESSSIDTWLSKMEVTIKNIASLVTLGNLVVNQLMEFKVIATFTTNVRSTKEPKWTMVMDKNVCQGVS